MKYYSFRDNDEKKGHGQLLCVPKPNDFTSTESSSFSSSSTSCTSSISPSPPLTKKRLDQSSHTTTTMTVATNNDHANSSNKCDDKISTFTPPSAALEVHGKKIKKKKGRSSIAAATAVYPAALPLSFASINNMNLVKIKLAAAAFLLIMSIAKSDSSFTSAFIIQPAVLPTTATARTSTSSSSLQMVSTTERIIRKSRIRKAKVATATPSRATSASNASNPNRSKSSRSGTKTTSSTVTATSSSTTVVPSRSSSTSRSSTAGRSRSRNTKTAIPGQQKSKKRSSSKTKVSSLAKTAESLYNLPSPYNFDGVGLYFEKERGVVLTEEEEEEATNDKTWGKVKEIISSSKSQSKLSRSMKVGVNDKENGVSTFSVSEDIERNDHKRKRRIGEKLEKSKVSMKRAVKDKAASQMSTRISTDTDVDTTKSSRTTTPVARIKTITNISKRSSTTRKTPNTRNSNKHKSSRAQQAIFVAPTTTKSRSSTMPGFRNREHTKRRASFRDGMKIVQDANSHNSNNYRMSYNSDNTRGQVHHSRGRSRSQAHHKDSIKAKINNVVNSEKEKRTRGKANSEAMYSCSASVPDSLIAFTNEIHLEERITPKEEMELGSLTQEAIRLQKLYDNLLAENGREPSDEEWCAAAGKINMEALQNAIEEGIEAKNQLVTSNLRMVQGVVNLYIRNGLGSQYNAGDLMQEGTVALIRAAEKFEPQRGFRFSTYAMYWIRAAVKRSQILQSRVINVPQRLHETHKKVTRTESQLKKELGRKPTSSELALASGLTESQLERCLKAISQQCFSLDAEIANTLKPNSGDRSTETSHNLISAKYDDVEYRELQSHLMKDDLVSTLKRYLSPHEVDLLLLRYGLMDEKTLPYGFSGPLTIAEVSRLVGLKPDKVRRMINKSLRQLRHLIAHEWEDFENVLQRY